MAAVATPLEVLEALQAVFCHGKQVLLQRDDGELKWRLQRQGDRRFKAINDDFFRLVAARFDMLYCADVDDAVLMQGTAVMGNKIVSRECIIQALELLSTPT